MGSGSRPGRRSDRRGTPARRHVSEIAGAGATPGLGRDGHPGYASRSRSFSALSTRPWSFTSPSTTIAGVIMMP